MKKKVLFIANTDMHIELFYLPYIDYFHEQGYEVHVATNTNKPIKNVDKKYAISIYRKPFNLGNIEAIKTLRKIIDKEKYTLISASTPMGGVIGRLAAKKSRKKYNTKLIYTAHGFHFFKGAPLKYHLLYYPVEKMLAKHTDVLITINKEDYYFSKKHLKVDTRLINGIGYHRNSFLKKISETNKNKLRKELEIKNDDYVIIYVAELSKRKRQEYLIKTISKMDLTNIKILLVGGDILNNKISKLTTKLDLQDNVKILGFRNDVSNLLDISDLVVSVSMQEGLPLNIMEAMEKEKTIIVTDCRGNRDLIKNNYNGLVVPIKDEQALIDSINKLKNDKKYATKLAKKNKGLVRVYDIEHILPQYIKIYEELLK